MTFVKGVSGNPKGKPIGTKSRTTKELRARLQSIIDNNLDSIEEDLQALEPKERIQCLEKLIRYVLPTMQSMEFRGELESKTPIQDLVEKMAKTYHPKIEVSG